MKRYKIKYSYITASCGTLITTHGCYMSSTEPTEQQLIDWATNATIGGGYDYKILNVSNPY
jgi:hypothetical protein